MDTPHADHSRIAPAPPAHPDSPICPAPQRVRSLLRAGRPLIMGILNATPDSFSDGGRFLDPGRAVEHGRRLAAEGADIIDVGGESTRPGARPPTAAEELDRVLPIVQTLATQVQVPVSIDTSRPAVMRAAVEAGAAMINDVRALTLPGALTAAADLKVPVCLMHMQGTPTTMQADPRYDDVAGEIRDYLAGRVDACLDVGIPAADIVIDPGFGFGKTLEHNLTLLARLDELRGLNLPILVGVSRKGLVGQLTGGDVHERLAGSLAAALLAVQRGAAILRVHDVAPTRDALTVIDAVSRHAPAPSPRTTRGRADVQLRSPRTPMTRPISDTERKTR